MIFSNKITNILAAFLLIFVFLVSVLSIKDDSLTMDEVAHLPAGYSYLTQKDMRLNPEHPPLIKDLAALPLLFIKGINFPSNIQAWQEDINGQWAFGYHFLYHNQNPTEKMIFWARIPMILVLILLGFYVFKWAKELYGNKAALLSLFLFSFSPTLLAHGRLVTTDVGATIGVFIATYYFIRALQNKSKKDVILAGIAFGIAQLCKFSVILLIPFFILLGLVFWLIKLGTFKQTLKILVLVFVTGYILVWPVYQYHVLKYPPEKQFRDTQVFLEAYPDLIKKPILWATNKPILRAYAQYLTGVLMVLHRGAFGHTTYFLGEISNLGWKNYFPIVYLIKEPLPLHVLTLIALCYIAFKIQKPFWINTFSRIKNWIKNNFSQFAMLIFIVFYWLTSLFSNLNIGVRHLLPVFPFTFLQVSGAITDFLKESRLKIKCLILAFFILWQTVSVISIYPHFLAYFNEIMGGPDKGYIYTVDSNLDWGQDLKRLKKWVEDNQVEKIYVDYFGGGQAQYYLKEKYLPWWGARNPAELEKGSYLAVSATFLQGGRGQPIADFDQAYGYYNWLDKYTPLTKIGYSIFVYKIE